MQKTPQTLGNRIAIALPWFFQGRLTKVKNRILLSTIASGPKQETEEDPKWIVIRTKTGRGQFIAQDYGASGVLYEVGSVYGRMLKLSDIRKARGKLYAWKMC